MSNDNDNPMNEEDGVSGSPMQAELENLLAEKNALYEKLARTQADFANARKRLEADLETRVQYQLSRLVDSMLPVIDNFERALTADHSKSDVNTIVKGMQVVHDQWLDILKRFQVESINPTAGTELDPHQHQAIAQEPSDQPANSITKVVQKGYTLNGKPLRPAMVVVSKGQA